jgi:hypothetical protein
MKNLFNKIFKKEPQFNYIIAEYQPTKGTIETNTKISEYDIESSSTNDEMEIDRLYQRA